MGQICIVGEITEHALHHPNIAIENSGDAPAWPLFQPVFRQRICFAHLMIRVPRVRDKPKQKLDTLRPSRPSRTTGRRPTKSDNRLQCHVVSACVTKKRESYEKVGMEDLCEQVVHTHDETCIVTDLAVVPSSYTKLADELFDPRGCQMHPNTRTNKSERT